MSMYGDQETQIFPGGDGIDGAKQSFKDETDVNTIIARFAKTGLLTPVMERPPMFIDVSEVGDYREAIDNVRLAQHLFMQLGSTIRAKFDNDPAEFLDFATDPKNEAEMRKLGLLPERREDAPRGERERGGDVPEVEPPVETPEVPPED